MGVAGIFVLQTLSLDAQVSTIKPGKWSTPSIWSSGIVPDAGTPQIRVAHPVTVPDDTTLIVNDVTLEDTLTVSAHAELVLMHDHTAASDLTITSGKLIVRGKLICQDSADFVGTTNTNTFFNDSAVYEHQYFNTAGEPPLATWSPASTLLITGYTFGKSLNSAKWNQSYGNVVYDCAAQRSGSFVEMLGNIRDVNGNFTVRNTNGGILRFSLDKTSLTTIEIAGDLIVEGRSEFWIGRNSNINVHIGGDFVFRSTATASTYLTTTGHTDVTIAGSALINSSAPLRFASSGGGTGTMRIKKNFMLERGTATVLPVGTGSVIFEGSGDHALHAAGNLTSGIDVVVYDSANLSITNNSKIGGNLILRQSAKLTLPLNFSLEGNLDVGVGADLIEHRGTIQLTGPATQLINANGDTILNMTMTKPAASTVTLTGKLNVLGNLSMKSNDIALQSNGYLTLLSMSDDGSKDASVGAIPPGSSIEGNVVVQRYMSGEGKIYRYLSSAVAAGSVADCKDDFPVTGVFSDPSTGAGLASTSPSFFKYDETLTGNLGWLNFPASGLASENILEVGKGYAAYIRRANTPTVWDVTGNLNQQDINFALTYTATGDLLNDGWNLIGNPYASSIFWNASNGWEKFNVSDKIAVKDNGAGIFRYWSDGIGNLDGGRIAKGQAFWVQTSGGNPLLKIKEEAKSPLATEFHRSGNPHADFLELTLHHNGVEDRAYIRQKPATHRGLDAVDFIKWTNDQFNIAIAVDSFTLAVQNTEYLRWGEIIPVTVFFTKGSNGQFTISPNGQYRLQSIGHGTFARANVEIIDHFVNQSAALDSGYTFSVTNDERSYSPNRFSMIVTSDTTLHDISVTTEAFSCTTSPPLDVSLVALQSGVTYEVWLNDELVETYHAIDFNHIVRLETSTFQIGENRLVVKARTACNYKTLHSLSIQYVAHLPTPKIIEVDGILEVNTTGHVQWYLDGHLLVSDTLSRCKPLVLGNYEAEIDNNGCIMRTNYAFQRQSEIAHCYPVPANDKVNVIAGKDEEIYAIRLMDVSGRSIAVEAQRERGKHTLFIESLSPGLYTISVTTDHGTTILKMLKL
jgi:hypothetical protein